MSSPPAGPAGQPYPVPVKTQNTFFMENNGVVECIEYISDSEESESENESGVEDYDQHFCSVNYGNPDIEEGEITIGSPSGSKGSKVIVNFSPDQFKYLLTGHNPTPIRTYTSGQSRSQRVPPGSVTSVNGGFTPRDIPDLFKIHGNKHNLSLTAMVEKIPGQGHSQIWNRNGQPRRSQSKLLPQTVTSTSTENYTTRDRNGSPDITDMDMLRSYERINNSSVVDNKMKMPTHGSDEEETIEVIEHCQLIDDDGVIIREWTNHGKPGPQFPKSSPLTGTHEPMINMTSPLMISMADKKDQLGQFAKVVATTDNNPEDWEEFQLVPTWHTQFMSENMDRVPIMNVDSVGPHPYKSFNNPLVSTTNKMDNDDSPGCYGFSDSEDLVYEAQNDFEPYAVKEFGNDYVSIDVQQVLLDKFEKQRGVNVQLQPVDSVQCQSQEIVDRVQGQSQHGDEGQDSQDQDKAQPWDSKLQKSKTEFLKSLGISKSGSKNVRSPQSHCAAQKANASEMPPPPRTFKTQRGRIEAVAKRSLKRSKDALRNKMRSNEHPIRMSLLMASTIDFMSTFAINEDGNNKATTPEQDRALWLERIKETDEMFRNSLLRSKKNKKVDEGIQAKNSTAAVYIEQKLYARDSFGKGGAAFGFKFICNAICKPTVDYHFKELPNVIVCCNCGKKFPTQQYLFEHISSSHSPQLRFICPKCPLIFKDIEERQTHIHLIHGDVEGLDQSPAGPIYVTPESERQLKNRARVYLLKKYRNDSENRWARDLNPKCLLCDSYFPDHNALKSHFLKSHLERKDKWKNKIYTCRFCSTRLFSTVKYIYHLNQEFEKCGGIPCEPECGRGFPDISELIDHQDDCYWVWASENANALLKKKHIKIGG